MVQRTRTWKQLRGHRHRLKEQEAERKAAVKATNKNQKVKGKNIREFKNGPKGEE